MLSLRRKYLFSLVCLTVLEFDREINSIEREKKVSLASLVPQITIKYSYNKQLDSATK